MTLQTATVSQAITIALNADTLYHEADRVTGLWKAETDDSIRLFRGEVVESDSPGSGRSDDPDIEPFLSLDGSLELRKSLHLDSTECLAAQIGFIAIEAADNDTTLRLLINGVEVLRPPSAQVVPDARQYQELSWSRWYYVAIPPDVLRQGENEIRLSAVDGGVGWQLMVADYRDFPKGMEGPVVLPHDSHRCDDGDGTWIQERGEYVVRLLLDRYLPQGELLTPVIDGADEQEEPVKSDRTIEELQISWEADTSQGPASATDLAVSLRSGPHPSPDAAGCQRSRRCS